MHLGDLSDVGRLTQILRDLKVDEVYHLAAQSHVGVSFHTPISTGDVNAMGTLRLLEAMRMLGLAKTARFYNVSAPLQQHMITTDDGRREPRSSLDQTCLLLKPRRLRSTQFLHML
jgi:GDP-D-mannose dehydratase